MTLQGKLVVPVLVYSLLATLPPDVMTIFCTYCLGHFRVFSFHAMRAYDSLVVMV